MASRRASRTVRRADKCEALNDSLLSSMWNGVATVGDEVPELQARVGKAAASHSDSSLRHDAHRFSSQKPLVAHVAGSAATVLNLKQE